MATIVRQHRPTSRSSFLFSLLIVLVTVGVRSCWGLVCPSNTSPCACIDYGDDTIYLNCASQSLSDTQASSILTAYLGAGISPLSYLYMPSNLLTKVPDQLRQFPRLIGADLPGNRITTVASSGTFNFNRQYARIYLPLNTLTSIAAGAFQGSGYGNGTWIFLYNNRLTRFESGVFQSVLQQMAPFSGHPNTFIDIGNNPIDCSSDPCHLAWLLKDNRNTFLKNVYRGVCSNGVPFESVDQSIFNSCSGSSVTCPPYDPNVYTCVCGATSCSLQLIPTTTARPTCPPYDPNVYTCVCGLSSCNLQLIPTTISTTTPRPTCPPFDPNVYICVCGATSCQLQLIPTTTTARPTCPPYDPNVYTCVCGASSCQLQLIPTTTTARPTCPPYDQNIYTCVCGATSCSLQLIPTTTPARPTCPAYDPNVYICVCGATSCSLQLIPTTTARPTCPPYDPNVYTCVCGSSSCQLQLITTTTTARPTCPPFDPNLYICVCGTLTCQLQPPITPPPGSFICPAPEGLFPNPTSCSNFYACSNGNPYLMDCAPTAPGDNKLAFNPKTLECDYPENVPGCKIIKN